ncbi:superoxide dismutase [Cu-Zn], partial [Plakobranchus ocellatus]
ISQCVQGQSLMAEFDMGGVRGQATLTWAADTLSVALQMEASLGQTTVEIHPIWVNYDVPDICTSERLGMAMDGFSQSVTINNGLVTVTFPGVSSLDYVEGHSLVLTYQTDKKVCATIQKSQDYVTAEVTFRGSIYGDVYLRQANRLNSSTHIVTDLMTRSSATMGDWRISNSYPSCEQFMADVLTNIYNPTSSSSSDCGTTNQKDCAIGDLSSKLGNVYFSGSLGDSAGRRAYTDANLPLFADNSVEGLLMIILPQGNNVEPACGMINVYETRSATATFNNAGVQGYIKFTQKSPLDPTVTFIHVKGLSANAGGYHVHELPVPERLASTQGNMCAGERVSGHFNPFVSVVGYPGLVGYPSAATSTYDMYEVGDLSGKYGLLDGLQIKNETYTDRNLPLFGQNSIIGRSIVIHRIDGSRLVCVNIQPDYPIVVAEAVFTFPVFGRVMFMQAQGRPNSDTSVFTNLDYVDDREDTEGHAWMVGDMMTGSDMLEEDVTQRCRSAGSTFNPENLWPGYSESQYAQVCNVNTTVGCRIGDLSGKLGLLNIGSSSAVEVKARRWFGTSFSLPLSGSHSIIGKPLVIRNTGNTASLACATILPVHPIALSAELTSGPVTGTIHFSQMVGFGSRQTMVKTDLSGLNDGHSLMIHELPPLEGQSPCSDLGMVFDPLNIGNTQPSSTTDDNYKVGDLSRYAAVTEWSSYTLPLSGPNSINGRSVAVIDSNSSVLGCASIVWDVDGWTFLEAEATFSGEVTGTILMYQHVHPDGAMSDTTILTNLGYTNSSMSSHDHNWHTHVSPVSGDSQADTGRCDSTKGHYNPFSVALMASYSDECSPLNQLRCEVGDQSKKTMTLDLKGVRKLSTDTYLPLLGRFSVQGRSIVIHAENKAAARFTCTDIIPKISSTVVVRFRTPATFAGLDLADKLERINKAYADSVRSNPGEVVSQIQQSSQEETTVVVHFIGTRSAILRSRFTEVINDDNRRGGLGQFSPIINKAGIREINIFLVVLALVPSLVYTWMA